MRLKKTLLCGALLCAMAAPAAMAATMDIDFDTVTAGIQTTGLVQPGGSLTAVVQFTGDGTVTNFTGAVTYDTTVYNAVAAPNNDGSGDIPVSCTVNDGLGRIAVVTSSGSGQPIGDDALCDITFTEVGGAAIGSQTNVGWINPVFASDPGGSTANGGILEIASGPAPEFSADRDPAQTINLSTFVGGGDATATITVTNAGQAGSTLTVSTSGLAAPLSVDVAGPTDIAQNASQVYTITCDDANAGSFPDTLIFATNDSDENPVNFNIQCDVGNAPAPEVDPSLAPPGPVPQINDNVGGGATNAAAITLANIGTANLTLAINPAPTAPFTATLSSGNVAAGGSATLTIGCDATQAGNFVGQVTVVTNDSDEPTLVYDVTCVGSAFPEFDSTPAAGGQVTFVGPPGSTASGSVTLRNIGNAALDIQDCTASAGFTVTSPVFPISIAAGGTSTVAMTCQTPGAAGGSTPGTLTCSGISDTDETSATYNLQCISQVVAVPTMSAAGKALLAAMLAGLGLLGFALRRRMA